MVKKLLNYPECNVNCTDVEGRTIISRATEKLNQKNLAQFEFILKDKKANPNMSDKMGQSPLHYLCCLQKVNYVFFDFHTNFNKKEMYVAKRQKEDGNTAVTKKYEQEYENIIERAI